MTLAPPTTGSTVILSGAQVVDLVSLEEILEIQREAFMAQAAGSVTSSPNAWLRLPDQERRRGWLKILAGHESRSGALGVKVLARFADQPSGSNLGSLVLLFDDETGSVLAVMDGVQITALRTGAGAGLAAEVLAAPDAQVLAVVGSGVVAWHSVRAVLRTRPTITSVRVQSRSAANREELARRIQNDLGVASVAVQDVESAVHNAEIVITATNAPGPVLQEEHLDPGMVVLAMGIRHEIAPGAVARCRVVPDGADEAAGDGKFSVALQAGLVVRHQLGPELGSLLAERNGSHSPEGVTLFDSSGIAAQDVTLARHVLLRAKATGTGSLVDLGPGPGPV